MNIKIRVILSVVSYSHATQFFTFGEEHMLRVLEKKMLRKIFGPKREERKVHNEELHDFYFSLGSNQAG
jgi:hypothetical protein